MQTVWVGVRVRVRVSGRAEGEQSRNVERLQRALNTRVALHSTAICDACERARRREGGSVHPCCVRSLLILLLIINDRAIECWRACLNFDIMLLRNYLELKSISLS